MITYPAGAALHFVWAHGEPYLENLLCMTSSDSFCDVQCVAVTVPRAIEIAKNQGSVSARSNTSEPKLHEECFTAGPDGYRVQVE
jgi:hypothetical protein